MKHLIISILLFISCQNLFGFGFLIPMDETQKNHLKAYGIVYWTLQNNVEVNWLLNYRGGSFLIEYNPTIKTECEIRGVSYEIIADLKVSAILCEVSADDVIMDAVKLEKAPKTAVYSPKDKLRWDDAVTRAISYAEIIYEVIYDVEIVRGELSKYDWLHLHHEDFTGQYGNFYASYRNAPWYNAQVKNAEAEAKSFGFSKVSELKLFVAKSIKSFVESGGFLFAMCSGTDSFDNAI